MYNSKLEAIIKPAVEAFVTGLDGRYKEHASDRMLVALLLSELSKTPYCHLERNESAAELIIYSGDHNIAYEIGCLVFEHILERGCAAGGNGHHQAQYFSQAMMMVSIS